MSSAPWLIPSLVEQVQPSIVSIQVTTGQGGGQGSGVVDGANGIVVTNNHVVKARLPSGSSCRTGNPRRAGPRDRFATDLAVVKVDGTDLPSATFAKELPRVGELAIAMGNPLQFENTVTAGIVSALHRSLGDSTYVDLIQTDAPISPGNSGGALVNSSGEVIGISSAGIPSTENANSLGFAIPSTTVISVVEQLLANGVAKHAVPRRQLERHGRRRHHRSRPHRARLPRRRASSQGDVIVAAEGQPVTDGGPRRRSRSKVPGDSIVITVERGDQQIELHGNARRAAGRAGLTGPPKTTPSQQSGPVATGPCRMVGEG